MIEVTSASAKVAANASAAIEKIDGELASLQASSGGKRAEMRDLLAERSTADQRWQALVATMTAARADLHKAELAEEMTTGTDLETAAREETKAASALWDAAQQDVQFCTQEWNAREPLLSERLSYLQTSLDEAAQMSQSLVQRREELREIYDGAHAGHGRDEQAHMEAEFTAIAESRKAIVHMLAEVDRQEQALREQIPTRMGSWPSLARDVLRAHLDYQPGPMVRVLSAWEEVATTTGDSMPEINRQTYEAYIGETTLPLWHLSQYGPRSRYQQIPENKIDVPLRRYEAMLRNLHTTIDTLEQAEREKQVAARMLNL